MAQIWSNLLFAHWPLAPERLRALLPARLPPDTFNGQAWIGLVPFTMSGVRPRLVPPLPWLSTFPELNVRTYATLNGRPGVYFFSLDAGNPVAAALGRSLFRLPYHHASMRSHLRSGAVHYCSRRMSDPAVAFRARYRPTGPIFQAEPGSLTHWLTARYCLYSVGRQGQLLRAEIDHSPWPLQPATAEIGVNRMTAATGLALPPLPPLLFFAHRLQVRVWPLRPI